MAPYNNIPGINDYFVKRPIPGRQYMETGSIPISLFAHRAVLLGLVRRSIIKKINGKSRFCLFYCRSDLPTWGQVIGICARPDLT